MRSRLPLVLAVGLLAAMASFALADNLLKNADFKEGSQAWHGDGTAAYLKPDGTEGAETDPGVIPVLKVALSKGHGHGVSQTLPGHDALGRLQISVQVYASIDFKRSKHTDDYATDDVMPLPVADFAIRFLPDFFEHPTSLKPGEWVTVRSTWSSPMAADERSIYFIVPPGDGVVYLKNPSVTPE